MMDDEKAVLREFTSKLEESGGDVASLKKRFASVCGIDF